MFFRIVEENCDNGDAESESTQIDISHLESVRKGVLHDGAHTVDI